MSMKGIIKYVLCTIGVVIGAILLILLCFNFAITCKKTLIDTSISPDGTYELTLIEIGEPAWPFGAASGRLILNEGNTIISQKDFELRNDGCQMGNNNWAVTWNENHVEVILSGEEQYDEQFLLYYDGTVNSETLYEKTETDVAEQQYPIILDMGALKNGDGQVIFSISIDDFIASYNSFYRPVYATNYLSPSATWLAFFDMTPYFETDSIHHRFSEDEQMGSMPTVSIYTPENSDCIYEIELTFDDHGYQESLYEKFEEICLYSLQVILPALSKNEIDSLYKNLYAQTDDNFWGDYYTNGGTERPLLNMIYYYNGIGLYGYYGAGTANICIIPMTQETLIQFEQEGIEIREIV